MLVAGQHDHARQGDRGQLLVRQQVAPIATISGEVPRVWLNAPSGKGHQPILDVIGDRVPDGV